MTFVIPYVLDSRDENELIVILHLHISYFHVKYIYIFKIPVAVIIIAVITSVWTPDILKSMWNIKMLKTREKKKTLISRNINSEEFSA